LFVNDVAASYSLSLLVFVSSSQMFLSITACRF
jgi:hypothetical protein